jgi:FkbM family methyltransferase
MATRFGRQQTLRLDHLSEVRFFAANGAEVSRTLEYGGEPLSLAAFLFLLRPDDVVWDVGASVGLFAIHAARWVKRVIAFEPDPATHVRLLQNVELNGLGERCQTRQLALGEAPGIFELATDGLTGAAPMLGAARFGRHQNCLSVKVETIDHLLAAGEAAPTVLKIDIEGAEWSALKGARHLLESESRPRLLFIELHPEFLPQFGGTVESVECLLREAGYILIAATPREAQVHVLAVLP